jgi:diguanylate cyclase
MPRPSWQVLEKAGESQVNGKDEFDRTHRIGDQAVSYMKEHLSPAYPRNYEIWYNHAAGVNRPLSRSINDVLKGGGKMDDERLLELYREYLSADKLDERVEDVSESIVQELDRIAKAIGDAQDSAGTYGASLKGAADQLIHAESGDVAQTIIQRLVLMTHKMEARSKTLETKLADSKSQIDNLHKSLETARNESMTDSLTGAANRKRFDMTLIKEIGQAAEAGTPLSLLLGDIDHFKKFNDTWGHQTGDQVLRLVAHTLRTNVKGRDLAARYGGEEFAVILPMTKLPDAVVVGDQIRNSIKAKELIKKSTGENLGTITMSIGVACFAPDDTPAKMIARADAALYAAKRGGRDQVMDETQLSPADLEAVA